MTFVTRVRAAWARSPITRIRLVVASMLILIATLNLSLLFNNDPILRTLSALSGLILGITMFAAPLWGGIARVLHWPHTKLTLDTAPAFTTGQTDEGRWYLFMIDPAMRQWIADHCVGRVGVLPQRLSTIDLLYGSPRTLWFSRPEDALAFKMRWYGLSRDETVAALAEPQR